MSLTELRHEPEFGTVARITIELVVEEGYTEPGIIVRNLEKLPALQVISMLSQAINCMVDVAAEGL